MTTPSRGFDDAEFAARCTLVQAAMTQQMLEHYY